MTALLLDQGLAYSAAQLLRAKGLDALHVADLALGESLDEVIIERARALGRTICTLDADFHALMALSGAAKPSVLLIRVQGLKAAAAADLISNVCKQAASSIERGALITVTQQGMRVRRLPLHP